jgi:hypothetical protein
MGAHVYAANLSLEQLAQAVTTLRPQAPFAILERLDNLSFPAQDILLSVKEWDKGWLFGRSLELRWEWQGDTSHAVLTMAEGHSAPAEFCGPVKVLPPGETREYYLWSEGDHRVGRRIKYEALSPGGRAKLVIEEFRDPQSAKLLFYRYLEMRRE